MKKILLSFLFSFSFSLAGEIFDAFYKKLSTTEGIKGDFTQETYINGSSEKQTFKGILYAEKPDKIKIEYLTPIKQIVYVEKDKVIVYTPEENQAVISKLPEDFITVKIFKSLSSGKMLKEIFSSLKEQKNSNGYTIQLKPVDKSISDVSLNLKKDFKVNKINIIDKEGNRVIIIFDKFDYLSKPVEIGLKLPEGVEVLRY